MFDNYFNLQFNQFNLYNDKIEDKMNNILLLFLGLVLLVFCVVDLLHLHLILKELKYICIYIRELLYKL